MTPEAYAAKQALNRAAINKSNAEFLPVLEQVKANKYRNIKTAGSDSKKESKRLQELRLLQAAGAITALMPQVQYTLVPATRTEDGKAVRAATYTCDAQYLEEGKLIVEDVKSPPTRKLPRYVLAKKLMLQLYGVEIREI